MANIQHTTRYRGEIFIRILTISLAAIILIGWCIGGWIFNTMFLTLPRDGEQALIERISVDHCGERRCDEIQIFNLSRMDGVGWCVNLYVYSELYDTRPIADSYMMRRISDGVWRIEGIPGSICDTWSLPGRKYVLDKITGTEE